LSRVGAASYSPTGPAFPCRKLKEVIDKIEEGAGEQVVAAMRTILQGLFDAQIEKVRRPLLHSLSRLATRTAKSERRGGGA